MTNEISEKNKYIRNWIGRTFNNGKLTVVDGGSRNNYCVVRCSVCAEDTELLGDGLFTTYISNLNRGGLPCGCSKKHHWSLRQYEVIIRRYIKENSIPVEFLKIEVVEGKPSSESNIILFHKLTMTTYSVRISRFLNGKGRAGKTITKTEDSIENYNAQNKERRFVWDTGAVGNNGESVLGYHCSVCEEKGYEYIYEAIANYLFNNKSIPCVCAKSPRGKVHQYAQKDVESISSKCDKSETIKYVGYFKKGKQNIVDLYCENCRVGFERCFNSIKKIGTHCPRCHPPLTGYDSTKKGYLYILTVSKDNHKAIGFGITNKIKSRLATHKKNLTEAGYSVLESKVFSGYGTDVLNVEKYLKTIYRKQVVFCEGFVTESAPYDAMENIIGSCCKLTTVVVN